MFSAIALWPLAWLGGCWGAHGGELATTCGTRTRSPVGWCATSLYLAQLAGTTERVFRLDSDRGSMGSAGALAQCHVDKAFMGKYEVDSAVAAERVATALAAASQPSG